LFLSDQFTRGSGGFGRNQISVCEEVQFDCASREDGVVELHFFTHRELVPIESTAGCYIRVLDVDSIYTACSANGLPKSGIPRMEQLENKPWGLREFAIVDPDGNLLRIGQIING
jgi:hypothetical protein